MRGDDQVPAVPELTEAVCETTVRADHADRHAGPGSDLGTATGQHLQRGRVRSAGHSGQVEEHCLGVLAQRLKDRPRGQLGDLGE